MFFTPVLYKILTQVLSRSVAEAMEYYDDDDTIETRKFVRTFDRFFDMLNTRSLEEGIYKRKPDLLPYRKIDDARFKVYTCASHYFYIVHV